MAWVHGKNTIITLAATAITDCNTSELTLEADEHNMEVYGDNDGVPEGGLKRGTVTLGGNYKVGATGAAATIMPLVGTVVALTVKPEGTGVGKPLHTMNVHVKKFAQTAPVADYVKWTAELSKNGADAVTVQS